MTGAVMAEDLTGATVGELLDGAAARLRRAGIEGARRDARLLLAAALDTTVEQVLGYPERAVAAAARRRLAALVERRAGREPVSRILGRREFWGLTLRVTSATLDPRPDSECLVEAVLREAPDRRAPLRLLDLGTGTGCLLLALLSELPGARGVGLDASLGALRVARENAVDLGFAARASFVCGDWCAPLVGPWDIVVSNPPYVAARESGALPAEVIGFDPPVALFAGADGFDAYRSLIPSIAGQLASGGFCALEVGEGQAEEVECLLTTAGLRPARRVRDLAGRARCVIAFRGRGLAENQAKKRVGMGGNPD